MERIERNGSLGRRMAPTPETVFVFDLYGTVYPVPCRLADAPEEAEAQDAGGVRDDRAALPSPKVIRTWLAGLVVGVVGGGFVTEACLTEAGFASEPVPAYAVPGIVA